MRRTETLTGLCLVIIACTWPVAAEAVDVYTDRGAWEAVVTTVRMIEDFESETPGTYFTPYQTAVGINVETPFMIDLTIRDNGAVNNSREVLIQDYGNRSFFTFPANRLQLALGFDWVTGAEAWTLKFRGQDYNIPANSSGFLGLVDTEGESFGFELTSPAVVQDGLAVDNLEFSPALLVFTTRSSWEAQIAPSPELETFEGDSPGAYVTPYTTGQGCELSSLGAPIDLDVIDSGLVDGSRELHFSDHGEELSLQFPGITPQAGFGFDWNAPQESWSLVVRNEYINLYGTGSGFVGIVDQTQQTESFVLTSPIVVQMGVHIDNLTYSSGLVPVTKTSWGAIKTKYQ